MISVFSSDYSTGNPTTGIASFLCFHNIEVLGILQTKVELIEW